MTIQLDPTTCKPDDVYRIRMGDREFVGERVDPEDYLQWRLNRPASVWVRDVDVTVLHRLVPEPEATADGEALAQLVRDVRDGQAHSVTIDGVLIAPCDDRGLVEARHAQEAADGEVLRAAAQIVTDNRFHMHVPPAELNVLADRLEREHQAAQEKAAADAAREALIVKAARIQCDAIHGPGAFDDREPDDHVRDRYVDSTRALADAGYLVEAGEAS